MTNPGLSGGRAMLTGEQSAALVKQQARLLKELEAINEERTRRGMLPTCMFKVLSPELGIFNEPVRRVT